MNIPNLVKREIQSIDPYAEVILFGSRARGDYSRDSDWDFLILLEMPGFNKKIKEEIRDKLYELELKTGTVISTLIHSKLEWEKRSFTPIYQIIEQEGIGT